jgi:hypothetical protein
MNDVVLTFIYKFCCGWIMFVFISSTRSYNTSIQPFEELPNSFPKLTVIFYNLTKTQKGIPSCFLLESTLKSDMNRVQVFQTM